MRASCAERRVRSSEDFRSLGYAIDTSSMGSYASQFDLNGKAKLDLHALAQSSTAPSLLDAFNELEKAQYALLHSPDGP